jgi:hypothetical protein
MREARKNLKLLEFSHAERKGSTFTSLVLFVAAIKIYLHPTALCPLSPCGKKNALI